ncbi:DUF5778 family protein [Haloglomus litoreum]|uniref:DUF5778 family protein n=1 Tax=Haloglomus litoreum TaxID=3034026 RepID=UPI0023E7AA13|nr:DUF5778 family protein [Haloglomus sp. DT116]
METIDEDLVRRTRALLEPGEIELNGIVVHTDLSGEEEPALHQVTLETGNVIADHHPDTAPGDTYVYSGNDDPDFGVNQHQGLTLDGEAFVWECQQLLREGHYAVVVYYEAVVDHEAVVEGVEALDHVDRVVGVRGDGD